MLKIAELAARIRALSRRNLDIKPTIVEYSSQGVNTRFVVTSLTTKKVPPGRLYTQKYCPRGDMKNRFKEQSLVC